MSTAAQTVKRWDCWDHQTMEECPTGEFVSAEDYTALERRVHGPFRLIQSERQRQDAQWGGPKHDDGHHESDWLFYIEKQVNAADEVVETGTPDWRVHLRERLVKIAALAVAAIESLERQHDLTAPPDAGGTR